jgi:hypothetical protein
VTLKVNKKLPDALKVRIAGKQLWTEEKRIRVCESKDDGLSWQWLAEIPARPGDDAKASYHELHAVEAADGIPALCV